MRDTTTDADLRGAISRFERSAHVALEALAAVAPGDLERPTPCAGWDLRTLLAHLADSVDALTDSIATGTVDVVPRPRSSDDVVATARERIGHLIDALRAASAADDNGAVAPGTTTAAVAGAIELATHGWDIAVARGEPTEIPAGLAVELLRVATAAITDDTRETAFGPAVAVAGSAWPSDRFVAFLGRDPAEV